MAAILGFAASVLGALGTTEVVAAPPSAAVVYSYDVPHYVAPTTYANPDRGPRADYDTDPRSAVDLVSRGASARRQLALAPGCTTYDGAARLDLVDEATNTAQEQPEGDGRALTSLARSGVAANTGRTAARACSFAGATTVLMADGTRKPIEDEADEAAKGIDDSVVLARGGTNTAERFANGSGVTSDAAGNLSGVSVNSGRTVQ